MAGTQGQTQADSGVSKDFEGRALALSEALIFDVYGSFIPEEMYSPEEMNDLHIVESHGTVLIEGRESLVQKVVDSCSRNGALRLLATH